MKKCIVTGSSGLLGSAVVKELARQEWDPIGIDVADGPQYDVRSYDFAPLLSNPKIVSLIHLAGVEGGHEPFDRAAETIDINVVGTARILEALNIENQRRLAAEILPIKYISVSMMGIWDNLYQATKRANERLAYAWHTHKDVRTTVVRTFNVYGPEQPVEGFQKLISTYSHNAWRDLPLPVWEDGSVLVDLVHVYDVAKILVKCIYLPGGEKVDAGTGVPLTVQEIAENIIEHTGSTGGIMYTPMPLDPSEIEQPYAAEGLGWELLDTVPTPQLDWNDIYDVVDLYK